MSAKVFQKKKQKKNTPQPPRSSPSHGFVFFVVFGFLEVFATFGGKPQENKKKQKNTPQPPRSSPSHGFVFFVFFCFLEVFATFGGKPERKYNIKYFFRLVYVFVFLKSGQHSIWNSIPITIVHVVVPHLLLHDDRNIVGAPQPKGVPERLGKENDPKGGRVSADGAIDSRLLL